MLAIKLEPEPPVIISGWIESLATEGRKPVLIRMSYPRGGYFHLFLFFGNGGS